MILKKFDSLAAAGTLGDAELRVRDLALVSRQLRNTGHGTYGLEDTRLDFILNVQAGRTAYGVGIGGTARDPALPEETTRRR